MKFIGESGYYPPGAEHDPNAPYNQEDLEDKEFDVTISQTLSKNTTVSTNDYIPGYQYQESEWDGDGYCAVTYQESDDTSDTNWEEAYKSNHDTPLKIINLFKQFLEDKVNIENMEEWRRQYLINECSDWVEDDFAVCKD